MNPFMLAIEKGHMDVVKVMMKSDPDLLSMPLGSGSTVIHWALEKGYSSSAFFKVFLVLELYHVCHFCLLINTIPLHLPLDQAFL